MNDTLMVWITRAVRAVRAGGAILPVAISCVAPCFAQPTTEPSWQSWGVEPGVRGSTESRIWMTTEWDPDGDGPLPKQLVVCGEFTSAGGIAANRVARWDGSRWHPIGSGFDGEVDAITTWDPDGTGPLTAQLVAGGRFLRSGLMTLNRIARWDGTSWRPLLMGNGLGVNNVVNSLTTWDPDGEGPLHAQLVLGGQFTRAAGVNVNGIARWDGSAFYAFGSGLVGGAPSESVNTVLTWDPDGSGPLPIQVFAAGSVHAAGSPQTIVRWDGSAWQPFGRLLGRPPSDQVLTLTAWDPDGDGPMNEQLVAGGQFRSITPAGPQVNYIGRWDGEAWQPIGTGVSPGSGLTVYTLTTWDPDGAGPKAKQLIAGGSFITADGVTVNRIARSDGIAWHPLGLGMSFDVYWARPWDPDGPGPLADQLLAAGEFPSAGGRGVNGIARWDGSVWQSFGTGMDSSVRSLATWDPDGAGPLPSQLVTGGFFTSAGGVAVNRVAGWNGSAWQPFATGLSGKTRFPAVNALATWDPDGAGPLPDQLVVGGDFTTAGGATVNRIARWEASAWQPLGTGMVGTSGSASVGALASWDPDGDGPQAVQLVAGGSFTTAGGVIANNIARWNGTLWQPFPTDMNGPVTALAAWDADGPGPQTAQLVAGGDFTTVGDVTMNRIARWDGSAWQPFGAGMNAAVRALTTWDPDGDGPQTAHLVAGGEFTTVSGAPMNRIARWDGSAWQPFGAGFDAAVRSLTTWDPDGEGPERAYLVAGGDFLIVGSVTANCIARWNGSTWQPFATGFSATGFTPSVNALTTWDPDGDGPLPLQPVAGGVFGRAGDLPASRLATWSTRSPLDPLPPPCRADFNTVAGVTVQDVFDFLTAWFAGEPRADFNAVGGLTVQDIFDFLEVWFVGC